MGALEELRLTPGTLLMSEGDIADALYLLEDGNITLTIASEDGDVQVAELEGPAHFGELGMLLERRSATARTLTSARLWKLPRGRFEDLVGERPEIGLTVARGLAALLDRRQRQLIGALPTAEESRAPVVRSRVASRRSLLRKVLGTIVAVALPLALWNVTPPDGLGIPGWHVLLVLLGASVAWLAEPVPDFAVAVGMAVALGLLGLAPLEQVFGGFATTTWAISLGALALAAAMTRSGLLFRAALASLRAFPKTYRGQVTALLVGGAILTPLVPLAVARVAAIARVTRELAQAFAYPPRSNGSAGLAFAGLVGYWYFSNIFLTGMATNFIILELLSPAERQRFDWLTWLVAAAPAGLVTFAGGLLAILVLFRPERVTAVSAAALGRQQQVLGPLSRAELVTAAAIAILIAGLALQPVLGIEPAWLALAGLVVVMAGVLDRADFRTSIDWGFLILFGVSLGFGGVLRSAGLDRWVAGAVGGVQGLGPELTVMALAVATMASRIVLPTRPAIVLLALAFVPAAPAVGISGWLAGIVVLLAANVWVFPYQGLEYVMLREATGREAFTDRQGITIGATLAALRLAAIAACIPWWRALGLL